MRDIVLKVPIWRVATATFAAIAASVLSVSAMLGSPDGISTGENAVLLVIALSGFGYAYFAHGRYLRFMREGFEVKERFTAGRCTLWSDVAEIGVARFPSSAAGRLSYRYFAGIKLRDDAPKAMTEDCRKNREACGYDVLLESRYGMSLERFVAVLNERKRAAEKG